MTTKNGTKTGHTAALLPAVQAVKLLPRGYLIAQAELDNLDTAIAELDAALAEWNAAVELLAQADRKVRITQERCQLLKLAITLQITGTEVR